MTGRRWKLPLALAVLVMMPVGIWILRNHPPSPSSFYPKCVLHQWTGLHCPGCGGTRAISSLARGDFMTAVKYNPMLILGGPLLAAILWYKRRREKSQPKAMAKLSTFLAVVFVVYFIARNLPTPKTSPLAPPTASSVEVANVSADPPA